MKNTIAAFLVATSCAAMPMVANAIGIGTPATYNNLVWEVSSPQAFSSCTELRLDATGDLVNSNRVIAYGALNCPLLGGGYATTGTIYFGTDGSFNMTLMVGNGIMLQCVRWNGVSGLCQFSNSAGTAIGTASLTLRE